MRQRVTRVGVGVVHARVETRCRVFVGGRAVVDGRRRLVDVRDRDRERLLDEEPAAVGVRGPDRRVGVASKSSDGVRLQRVADDLEGAVVGAAGARDEGVGERVAGVGIGRRERADGAFAAGWFSATVAAESAMSVGRRVAATTPVEEKLKSDAGWSGGSSLSTSLIAAASAVTVQLAPVGSGAFGVSVIVSVLEPPTVKGCGVVRRRS